jgi:epoxyqueuosine reductase
VAEERLEKWLEADRHGEMAYMAAHGRKRSRPDALVPGTTRVICVRMNYWPGDAALPPRKVLDRPDTGYVARYALGRDYHKVLRKRLQRLADRIEQEVGAFGYRAFTDSAPVMEKPLAEKAGLGWIGKHTNLLNRHEGSWFFLGELYTDLPLPVDEPAGNHCGTCRACIDACPTGAITGPYQLDARLCISYLTIEQRGSIPAPLRPMMGNRIFGCDDCQAVCPWNRYARQAEPGGLHPPSHGHGPGSGLVRILAPRGRLRPATPAAPPSGAPATRVSSETSPWRWATPAAPPASWTSLSSALRRHPVGAGAGACGVGEGEAWVMRDT